MQKSCMPYQVKGLTPVYEQGWGELLVFENLFTTAGNSMDLFKGRVLGPEVKLMI